VTEQGKFGKTPFASELLGQNNGGVAKGLELSP